MQRRQVLEAIAGAVALMLASACSRPVQRAPVAPTSALTTQSQRESPMRSLPRFQLVSLMLHDGSRVDATYVAHGIASAPEYAALWTAARAGAGKAAPPIGAHVYLDEVLHADPLLLAGNDFDGLVVTNDGYALRAVAVESIAKITDQAGGEWRDHELREIHRRMPYLTVLWLQGLQGSFTLSADRVRALTPSEESYARTVGDLRPPPRRNVLADSALNLAFGVAVCFLTFGHDRSC
jgi:hypothetical protein